MRRHRLAAALIAGLLLASCGGGDDDVATGTTAADPSTSAAGPTATPSTGTSGAAPIEQLDFVAPDVRGGQVTGADFAGQDLVVWFWAPW